jgi:hypothetical protein
MNDCAQVLQSERQDAHNNAVPSSNSQSAIQGSTRMPKREYEFFVTTNELHQPEGTERGRIRRLVMRNFFDTKAAKPEKSVSEHNSASTVMAKGQLKNRFRLSRIGPDGVETTKMRRNSKEETDTAKRKRPSAKRTLSAASNASSKTDTGTNLSTSPNRTVTTIESQKTNKMKEPNPAKTSSLLSNPSPNLFDPFDVLPVPGSPALDTLFKLCPSPCPPSPPKPLTWHR